MTFVADSPAPAIRPRIDMLDALRGFALFGMLLVHATYYVKPATGALDNAVLAGIHLGAETKFYTLFSLLFGMSFAVQMRSLDARGVGTVTVYLRRVLVLGAIGLATHLLLGYWVLVLYAAWALVLLLFHRASPRTLRVAIVLLLVAPSLQHLTAGSYELFVRGRTEAEAGWKQTVAQRRATFTAIQHDLDQGSYRTAVAARWRQLVFRLTNPWLWTSLDPFLFFLLGMLAIRTGFVESAETHRRWLWSIVAGGLAMFVIARVLIVSQWEPVPNLGYVRYGLAVFSLLLPFYQENWLGLAYAAGMALLMTGSAHWHRRLLFLSWAGRMALTNYVLQIVLLEALFSRHALHLQMPVIGAPLFAAALFALQIVASRWWFERFTFGPFEWLWRSLTYVSWQPLRHD